MKLRQDMESVPAQKFCDLTKTSEPRTYQRYTDRSVAARTGRRCAVPSDTEVPLAELRTMRRSAIGTVRQLMV